MVDTAWDDEQTCVLLDWIAAELGRLVPALVSRVHPDRRCALAAAQERGIESHALDLLTLEPCQRR